MPNVVALDAFRTESAVVEVRADVVELGVGVGEQMPGDDQDGATDREDGFLPSRGNGRCVGRPQSRPYLMIAGGGTAAYEQVVRNLVNELGLDARRSSAAGCPARTLRRRWLVHFPRHHHAVRLRTGSAAQRPVLLGRSVLLHAYLADNPRFGIRLGCAMLHQTTLRRVREIIPTCDPPLATSRGHADGGAVGKFPSAMCLELVAGPYA